MIKKKKKSMSLEAAQISDLVVQSYISWRNDHCKIFEQYKANTWYDTFEHIPN